MALKAPIPVRSRVGARPHRSAKANAAVRHQFSASIVGKVWTYLPPARAKTSTRSVQR